ncbi:metallophosphoesterase [bacterium]|nr:metallophosphoesterase [bacterium]
MSSFVHFPSSEPELEEVEIVYHKLPDNIVITAVLISDLHIRSASNLPAIFYKVEKLSPSFVFLLGDNFAKITIKKVREFINLFGLLNPPLGKFAILGNGDEEELFLSIFNKAGVHLLKNEYFLVNMESLQILLAGVDFKAERISNLLASLPPSDLSILLSHRPDVILSQGDWRKIDLVLSGHTHGGQIRLPFIGPLFTKSRLPRRYSQGLSSFGHLYLYVSRGIGETKIPIRFFCPPEITLLKIKGNK